VQFRVLGPLEVLDHDQPLALGSAKQRALLAILLLKANEVVSSDRLIDELWGAEPPRTAAKSLHVFVSRLRKVVESGRATGEPARVLVTRSPGYLLRVEPEQLDLERFQRLTREGREAMGDGDPDEAAAKLNAALALWRGEPLADLAHASFAQGEVSRLEEMRLGALEDRIDAELRRGHHAEAVGELERLVAAEPLRERPRALLMLALYRAGRQADALEVYRSARRALVEELGIEPGRELKQLEAAILAQDRSLDLPISYPARSQAPPTEEHRRKRVLDEERPRDEFVGREDELRELAGALEAALHGRGSVCLIGGEPGIGKSRLTDELSERARLVDAEILSGRCWEAGGAPAYWPWVQALRAHLRQVDASALRRQVGAHGAEVAQVFPELRELLPDLPVLEAPESEGARFRLFDATASFLQRAAAERPLLLVIEDLHAADVPSLLLLRFFAGEIADARVLVIGTYRDIELSPGDPLASALGELARQPATRTLLLEGFGESDVSRLIEVVADASPSPQMAAAVHTGTGGNPLFVGELVRLLASEGRLVEPIHEADVRRSIPRGVRDVIAKRLTLVSDASREMLGMGSVLGREFSIHTLAHAGGRTASEILDVLDETIAEGLVAEMPGSADRLRFTHVLIRDALYDQLGAFRRRQLHGHLGEVLEAGYAADVEPHLAELAQHFFAAGPEGDPAKAFDYARRAGDRAIRLLAFEEAARLYALALRVLDDWSGDHRRDRCRTLILLGNAHLRAGDQPGARAVFLQAADQARALGDHELLGEAALGYGGLLVWTAARGDPHLIVLLEEALGALEERDSALRAKLIARLSGAVRDQPKRQRCVALSAEAVEMARRIEDSATLAYALDARCIALAAPATLMEFREATGELTALAKETGEPRLVLTARFYRTFSDLYVGAVARARRELDVALQEAEDLRAPSYSWAPTALAATLALVEGEFERGQRLTTRAFEFGQHAQPVSALAAKRLQTFLLKKELGGLEGEAEALAAWSAADPTWPILRCALASLYSDLCMRSEAASTFEELAEADFAGVHLDEEWLVALSLLAEVCVFLGDQKRAALLYDLLFPYADWNAVAWPEVAMGAVARPLGLLASMLGMDDAAERHFEAAIALNGRIGARPWVAHTEHDYARMLLRRGTQGDTTRAAELLRAARGVYEELGMTGWRAKATADLASLP
jgi:DNA-binding SARP family transcriptional activator